jgi:hypothetical protein
VARRLERRLGHRWTASKASGAAQGQSPNDGAAEFRTMRKHAGAEKARARKKGQGVVTQDPSEDINNEKVHLMQTGRSLVLTSHLQRRCVCLLSLSAVPAQLQISCRPKQPRLDLLFVHPGYHRLIKLVAMAVGARGIYRAIRWVWNVLLGFVALEVMATANLGRLHI